MFCLTCNSLSFDLICKKCQKELLTPTIQKRDDIISFYKKVNNFNHFSAIKSNTQENTNVELNSNEYRIYKQEEVDGIWYVGYEYLK
jgi:hypothetical protein